MVHGTLRLRSVFIIQVFTPFWLSQSPLPIKTQVLLSSTPSKRTSRHGECQLVNVLSLERWDVMWDFDVLIVRPTSTQPPPRPTPPATRQLNRARLTWRHSSSPSSPHSRFRPFHVHMFRQLLLCTGCKTFARFKQNHLTVLQLRLSTARATMR